jgi:hypothetical protein
MFADPKKGAVRRIKRRLKAGASILVAIAAGAFLACQRGGGEPAAENPGGPDARTGPHEREDQDAGAEAGGPADAAEGGAQTALVALDAGTEDAGDGGAALVVRDAGADAGDAGKRKVDRVEHRKGMPMRDNLLE